MQSILKSTSDERHQKKNTRMNGGIRKIIHEQSQGFTAPVQIQLSPQLHFSLRTRIDNPIQTKL